MRKKLGLVLALAVLLVAVLPATVFAASDRTFSASSEIKRTDPGSESLDLSTGLLTTLGQVFEGKIDDSTWPQLRRADITVNQNSAIGADIFDLVTNATGTTPLAGMAWGTFVVERGRNTVTGEYAANLVGSLTIDPTCTPTDVFAGAGIPLLPVRVQVADEGTWAVVEGTAKGQFTAIDEAGGSLTAVANGCLGSEETATISITGEIGRSGRRNNDLQERLDNLKERLEELRDDRGGWRERVDELRERADQWRERFVGGDPLSDRLDNLRDRLRDLFASRR